MEGCNCKPAKSYAERIIEHREFVALVKKMRDAQKSFDALSLDQELEIDIQGDIVDSLEREVDEYLKKMESIDRRKALEAENTEFDYGHNVNYINKDE